MADGLDSLTAMRNKTTTLWRTLPPPRHQPRQTPVPMPEPAPPTTPWLETVDRALYARPLGFGDGPLPDPSEAWRMTQEAAEAALGRAGAVRDLAVAPVIREILGTLRSGVPVKQGTLDCVAGRLL